MRSFTGERKGAGHLYPEVETYEKPVNAGMVAEQTDAASSVILESEAEFF